MREAIGAGPDDPVKVMAMNSLVVEELSPKTTHSNSLDFIPMMAWGGETGPRLQVCYGRLHSALRALECIRRLRIFLTSSTPRSEKRHGVTCSD